VKRAGFDFSFWRVGSTRCGLCQGDFTVEMRLLFGAEFEGHAAGGSDALEHREGVRGVLGILQPGNHGLRRAQFPGRAAEAFRLRPRVLTCSAPDPSQSALVADPFSRARLGNMEVTLHIPDEIVKRLSAASGDISRRVLESVALEGYRDQTLTLYQLSEMLGLSRVETEDFLGRHRIPLAVIDEGDLDREAALFDAASRRNAR
jgi:predicted HTH domain antitoxin